MDISFSEAKGMFSTVVELIKKGSQIEAQAQIQKLQEQYLGLHAENLELKQDLLELKSKYKQQENMIFEEPFFFEKDGENKEGALLPEVLAEG
jgi:cell division protein FtsB